MERFPAGLRQKETHERHSRTDGHHPDARQALASLVVDHFEWVGFEAKHAARAARTVRGDFE